MKWFIYIFCLVAIATIVVFLNSISEGNPANIGLGDFLVKIFGYGFIAGILEKQIWKDK